MRIGATSRPLKYSAICVVADGVTSSMKSSFLQKNAGLPLAQTLLPHAYFLADSLSTKKTNVNAHRKKSVRQNQETRLGGLAVPLCCTSIFFQ